MHNRRTTSKLPAQHLFCAFAPGSQKSCKARLPGQVSTLVTACTCPVCYVCMCAYLEPAAHHPPAHQALRTTHHEQQAQPAPQGAIDEAARKEVCAWDGKANAQQPAHMISTGPAHKQWLERSEAYVACFFRTLQCSSAQTKTGCDTTEQAGLQRMLLKPC